MVGVKGRPLFTRPMAVWHHLKRLQKYNAERWAQQHQSRVAKQRKKREHAQGHSANGQNDSTRPRERCPGKARAKKGGAYASDFYAGPVLPEGARGAVQYRVEGPSGEAATQAPGGGAMPFTPPQRCAVARRPKTRPRLLRLWLCATHNHRQCATCAAVGRGVRHCCARQHTGHPPLPIPPGRWVERGRRGCAPQGGGTPQLSGPSGASRRQWEEARPSREDGGTPTPPPRAQSGHEWRSMTRLGMDAPGRRSHNPTPPEVLTQARPLAETPVGAGRGGARTVRCTDFGGALGDHGGPGPIRVSLFNIVLPHVHTHTHTHTGLHAAEIVPLQPKSLSSFEAKIITTIWGPSRPARAKEIVFCLLCAGHRIAPTLIIPYQRAVWLAKLCRTRGPSLVLAQAIWEKHPSPQSAGPFGRALQTLHNWGWTPEQGWWEWTAPGVAQPLNLVGDKAEVKHHVRAQLIAQLIQRRPRQFTGMHYTTNRRLVPQCILSFTSELERSLLRTILAGEVWTALRAHQRGLRPTSDCPFCGKAAET